jgi:hypothetical protein
MLPNSIVTQILLPKPNGLRVILQTVMLLTINGKTPRIHNRKLNRNCLTIHYLSSR